MNKQTVMFGAGAALVLVLAVVMLSRKGAQAVAAVGAAINPVSADNVFYQGANAIGRVVTGAAPGDASFSIGSWFGGIFKSDAEKKVDVMLSGSGPLDSAVVPAVPRAPAPVVTARPRLYIGLRGDAVRELQGKLNISADGVFGLQTQVAVKDFQRSRGLVVDGIVGASTWAALDAPYWLIH